MVLTFKLGRCSELLSSQRIGQKNILCHLVRGYKCAVLVGKDVVIHTKYFKLLARSLSLSSFVLTKLSCRRLWLLRRHMDSRIIVTHRVYSVAYLLLFVFLFRLGCDHFEIFVICQVLVLLYRTIKMQERVLHFSIDCL